MRTHKLRERDRESTRLSGVEREKDEDGGEEKRGGG